MRILYLGSLNEFSRIPLQMLLKAGVDICAVWVPFSVMVAYHKIPSSRLRASLSELGLPPWAQGVPVEWIFDFDVSFMDEAMDLLDGIIDLSARKLKALAPDVVCVACLEQRIPSDLLAIPKHGFLNLHPSLLPRYRGPAPLFWQFRAGERWTGVTVHWMDASLDTGDIAGQRRTPLPSGITGPEADRLLGTLAGELLIQVLTELEAGRIARRPQRPGGSYYSWPQAEDFRLETRWPARRAYNFMRGTAEWARPYPVRVAGEELWLGGVLEYSEGESLPVSWERVDLKGTNLEWLDGQVVRIQFTPGVLTALLSSRPRPRPPGRQGE